MSAFFNRLLEKFMARPAVDPDLAAAIVARRLLGEPQG